MAEHRGPGGRGKPAREEGPGGRPGRGRHEPTTGPGQNTIEVTFAIEAPAGGRKIVGEQNNRTRGRTEQWRWEEEVKREGNEGSTKNRRVGNTQRVSLTFGNDIQVHRDSLRVETKDRRTQEQAQQPGDGEETGNQTARKYVNQRLGGT